MTMNRMAGLWVRTGLVWFLAAMAFGMYLGVTGQFGASSAHAHLGLLGWVSSIAFAYIHSAADPEGELARRGAVHWGLHNAGLVVQVSSLWLVVQTGNGMFGMFIGIGGLTLILATLWFAITFWPRLRGR